MYKEIKINPTIMKDYKKVMLSGLKESYNLGNIREEEVDCIKEAIQDTYTEMV